MKSIEELIKLGFEENYVSQEESGDNAFNYLVFESEHGISLISDDYHPNTDQDSKVKVFYLEGNQNELSDKLIEEIVKK